MYVRKSGKKYRAIESVKIDGKWKQISVTMEKNTAQARSKAAAQIAEKIGKPTAEMTYQDLVNVYIKYQEATLRESTWRRNKASLNRLAELFGPVKLSDLTAGMITSKLLEKSGNPATFNEYLKRLKAMIRWAYRNDYMETAACVDKIQPMKDSGKKEKLADKYLEPDELKQIIDAAPGYYASVFEFLALSGLRIGELIALDDEDVTADTITVRRTYDFRHGVMNEPKTPTSYREVHIQPELQKTVRDIRHYSRVSRLFSGVRAPYFVVNHRGNRLSYDKANRIFRGLCVRLVGRPLTLHALRHTHVALMAAAGVDLDAIARRLGHSNPGITRDIYYHVTQKQRQKDDAAFDAVSVLN